MGDCDLDDDEYFSEPLFQEKIEIDYILNECNIPTDRSVGLKNIIGKTIKFCNKTNNRKNNTILIVFTDETFLVLQNNFDNITDAVNVHLSHNEDYQNLMIEGNLISKEKVDKYNKFWKDRQEKSSKEQELKLLKSLLARYPDFENNK